MIAEAVLAAKFVVYEMNIDFAVVYAGIVVVIEVVVVFVVVIVAAFFY